MRRRKSKTKGGLYCRLECVPSFAEQSIHQRQLSCAKRPRKQVQIIRLDAPTHWRTEQLAYPNVRKLLHLKATKYYQSFDVRKKLQVNQKLSKSVNSLYSRLSNQTQRTMLSLSAHKKHNQSAERQSRAYEEHLLSWAQPRMSRAPPKPQHSSVAWLPYETEPQISARLAALAQSRRRYTASTSAPKQWQLTAGMRQFKPTGRLLMLAKCKPVVQPATDPWCIKKQALKYKISARLQDLSVPATYRQTTKYQFKNDMSFYQVSRAALKAQVGQRIEELAKPRDTFAHRPRANPYKVSPAALRAKLTQRLRELARPRCMQTKRRDSLKS